MELGNRSFLYVRAQSPMAYLSHEKIANRNPNSNADSVLGVEVHRYPVPRHSNDVMHVVELG